MLAVLSEFVKNGAHSRDASLRHPERKLGGADVLLSLSQVPVRPVGRKGWWYRKGHLCSRPL
jgi:hypothetical protein